MVKDIVLLHSMFLSSCPNVKVFFLKILMWKSEVIALRKAYTAADEGCAVAALITISWAIAKNTEDWISRRHDPRLN